MAVCWRAQKILTAIRAADPLTGLQRGLPPARHIHPLQNHQANDEEHRRGRDGDALVAAVGPGDGTIRQRPDDAGRMRLYQLLPSRPKTCVAPGLTKQN